MIHRIIYSAIFFTIALVSVANDEITGNRLILDNQIWEYYTGSGVQNRIDTYKFNGKETVGDHIYDKWCLIKRIDWATSIDNSTIEWAKEWEGENVEALLREEDGRVYMLLDGVRYRDYDSDTQILSATYEEATGKEALLYDYNLSEGDRFNCLSAIYWGSWEKESDEYVISDAEVTGISDWRIGNTDFKRINILTDAHLQVIQSIYDVDLSNPLWENSDIFLSGTSGEPYDIDVYGLTYVERLGNVTRGTLINMANQERVFLTSCMGSTGTLIHRVYTTDGDDIYRNSHTPDAPAGLSDITSDSLPVSSALYDLMGHEIRNPQPGTIYIHGGKKYVAR